ncbi:hypothetical protein OG21DRAFT_4551 [Imleria badia]|nr:hypothetical protein OG21DRAFT_4551 [Imleria badia]
MNRSRMRLGLICQMANAWTESLHVQIPSASSSSVSLSQTPSPSPSRPSSREGQRTHPLTSSHQGSCPPCCTGRIRAAAAWFRRLMNVEIMPSGHCMMTLSRCLFSAEHHQLDRVRWTTGPSPQLMHRVRGGCDLMVELHGGVTPDRYLELLGRPCGARERLVSQTCEPSWSMSGGPGALVPSTCQVVVRPSWDNQRSLRRV